MLPDEKLFRSQCGAFAMDRKTANQAIFQFIGTLASSSAKLIVIEIDFDGELLSRSHMQRHDRIALPLTHNTWTPIAKEGKTNCQREKRSWLEHYRR